MNQTIRNRSLFSCLFLLGCTTSAVGPSRPTDPGKADDFGADDGPAPSLRVCAPSNRPGLMACHARIATSPTGVVPYATAPSGLAPADLEAAYEIDTSGGTGATIAIVDSNDDPNAESDMDAYRKNFGLPACTKESGCFRKMNQNGKTTPLPAADQGWAQEIALDLEMASASCPKCKILLVEADSAEMDDLGIAVDTAVKLGGTVVSASFGGPEDPSITTSDGHFDHPGVQILVSAGDEGYEAEYPASSQYVTAVGGTSLKKSSTARGWTEKVWGTATDDDGGTGSGCSAYEPKPSWQTDASCANRTVADVSAVADPATGVAVYETYAGSGWAVFGGTSAAAPLVAGIMASSGHGKDDASLAYAHHAAFHDVTSGTNGSCDSSYLCKAKKGYDGPTGNGTPNGGALAALTADVAAAPDTCAHDVCTAGDALAASCDACATQLCAADAYCCDSSWDAQCVAEAADVCGACE